MSVFLDRSNGWKSLSRYRLLNVRELHSLSDGLNSKEREQSERMRGDVYEELYWLTTVLLSRLDIIGPRSVWSDQYLDYQKKIRNLCRWMFQLIQIRRFDLGECSLRIFPAFVWHDSICMIEIVLNGTGLPVFSSRFLEFLFSFDENGVFAVAVGWYPGENTVLRLSQCLIRSGKDGRWCTPMGY